MADPDSNYSLDQYITQLRNTVHAAYEDGYDRTEIHNRFEGLLFELREDHRPRIDTRDELRTELDLFLRDAYLPTDQVIEVLEAKIDELDGIGAEIGEGQFGTDDVVSVDGDEVAPTNGDEVAPTSWDEVPPFEGDEVAPTNGDEVPPSEGDEVAPTNGDEVPPSEGDEVAPTNGDEVPLSEGDEMPPTDGDAVPPTDETQETE